MFIESLCILDSWIVNVLCIIMHVMLYDGKCVVIWYQRLDVLMVKLDGNCEISLVPLIQVDIKVAWYNTKWYQSSRFNTGPTWAKHNG
jgi:hypothetical protein